MAFIRPASEVVQLFEPPDPSPSTSRTNCPHLQPNLLSYHSPASWPSGSLPAAGADVTLPANVRMLLSRDAGVTLGRVTIPSTSELILGENATHGVALDATGIAVYGALRAGSRTCRLATSVVLTLHGSSTTCCSNVFRPSFSLKHTQLTSSTFTVLSSSFEVGL